VIPQSTQHPRSVELKRGAAVSRIRVLREAVGNAHENLHRVVEKAGTDAKILRCTKAYTAAVSRYRMALQEMAIRRQTTDIQHELEPSGRMQCTDYRWRSGNPTVLPEAARNQMDDEELPWCLRLAQ
jgi:hypothetical protein